MKKRFSLVMSAAVLAPCCMALADGDVLVWSTGNDNGDTSAVGAYIDAYGDFDSVTSYNQEDANMPDLNNYDRVLYFSNSVVSGIQEDNGDALYQFSQNGGRVVLAAFLWNGFGDNSLAGDMLQLDPFVEGGLPSFDDASMDWNDGSAYFDGVNSLTTPYANDVTLSEGATLHASYDNGLPLLASKGNVVAVNVFPDNYLGNMSGDYQQLLVNALTVPIPAPGALALLGVGAIFTTRRRR